MGLMKKLSVKYWHRWEYSSEILCLRAIEAAQKHKLVKVGDTVVFAGGVPLGIPGRTNLIRVCTVD